MVILWSDCGFVLYLVVRLDLDLLLLLVIILIIGCYSCSKKKLLVAIDICPTHLSLLV